MRDCYVKMEDLSVVECLIKNLKIIKVSVHVTYDDVNSNILIEL